MRIELKQGETLEVGPADSDGTFTISYGDGHLKVEVDLADTTGREGIIYDERYGLTEEEIWGEDGTMPVPERKPVIFGGKNTGPVNCNLARGWNGEPRIDMPGRCERCGKTFDEIDGGGCIFWTINGDGKPGEAKGPHGA